MECIVRKREGGGKRKEIWGGEGEFRVRISFFFNPNSALRFLSLFAQLLFTITLLAQTNRNSLQSRMTGRWNDNVCFKYQ